MADQNSSRWLLVSDVDGTLTGNDGGVRALAGLGGQVSLVLNSSRPRASVAETLHRLPSCLRVEGLITGMGTEVFLMGSDQEDWTSSFRDWDRRPVDEFMGKLGIMPHRPEFQARYKASFSVPAERWPFFRRRVLGIAPGSRVITSGESDFDVIPAKAGKAKAMSWVMRQLGFVPSRVIVAGDSGNDLDMFKAARMGIAVSNARPELVEQVNPAKTYFAALPHALGIVEGLGYWGALPASNRNEETLP